MPENDILKEMKRCLWEIVITLPLHTALMQVEMSQWRVGIWRLACQVAVSSIGQQLQSLVLSKPGILVLLANRHHWSLGSLGQLARWAKHSRPVSLLQCSSLMGHHVRKVRHLGRGLASNYGVYACSRVHTTIVTSGVVDVAQTRMHCLASSLK